MSRPSTTSIFLKIIGFIVLLLGSLNTMLAWKGGFVGSDFYMVLIGSGLLLLLMGSILGQRAAASGESDEQ